MNLFISGSDLGFACIYLEMGLLNMPAFEESVKIGSPPIVVQLGFVQNKKPAGRSPVSPRPQKWHNARGLACLSMWQSISLQAMVSDMESSVILGILWDSMGLGELTIPGSLGDSPKIADVLRKKKETFSKSKQFLFYDWKLIAKCWIRITIPAMVPT